jgi:hypothetical protein
MITKVTQDMQHIAEVSSAPATYVASAASIVFGLTVSEWQAVGVIGALILGALTYGTTLYFKRKHLELAKKGKE